MVARWLFRTSLSVPVVVGLVSSGTAATMSKAVPPDPTGARGELAHSRQRGTFGDTRIGYDVDVERFAIAPAAGGAGGTIVSFSYQRLMNGDAAARRPVVFLFNGGPGASSAWIHMAGFGPRRVVLPSPQDGSDGASGLVENRECILDAADLVFVDPIGTGYSRLDPGAKASDFFGVDQDAHATADLIRQWLTRHDRWGAPVYLLGESYGTIRAAATLRLLMGGTAVGRFQAIRVGGVMLLGSVLDEAASRTGIDADQGEAMLIPTYAAIAWHYGKAGQGQSLDAFTASASAFARDQYLPALYMGDELSASRRAQIASSLASLIGLPVAHILQARLRIAPAFFASTLLAEEKRRISLYDARYSWPLADETGHDPVGEDPSMTRLGPSIMSGIMRYMDDELRVPDLGSYELISWVPNRQWENQPERNYAADIGRAMRQNPEMRLVVGAGWYDLATPIGAARHAVGHGDIPYDRVKLLALSAGHMTYVDDASRAVLNQALRALVSGPRP